MSHTTSERRGAWVQRPLTDLLAELPQHRRVLREAWSAKTVHPDYTFRPRDPAGQCGVTSMWVCLFLRGHGYESHFTLGSVAEGARDNVVIEYHAWTEVDTDDGPLIIDLTASQGEGVEFEVIADSRQSVADLGIFHQPRRRLSPMSPNGWKHDFWGRYRYFTASLTGVQSRYANA